MEVGLGTPTQAKSQAERRAAQFPDGEQFGYRVKVGTATGNKAGLLGLGLTDHVRSFS